MNNDTQIKGWYKLKNGKIVYFDGSTTKTLGKNGKPRYIVTANYSDNVWCYTKEAIISTKFDAEYKCFLNHKCFCGVPNRLFCIARVISCLFYFFLSVGKSLNH